MLPGQPRIVARFLWLSVLLSCAACEPRREAAPDSVQQPADELSYLARLYREQLTADDPVLLEQAIMCERHRVATVIGYDSSRLRFRELKDTLFSIRDVQAQRRVGARLGGSVIASGDNPICRSFNTVADSVLPLPRVPR